MQPTFSVGKDRGKVYSTRLAFGKLGSILAPARKNCLAQRVKKKNFTTIVPNRMFEEGFSHCHNSYISVGQLLLGSRFPCGHSNVFGPPLSLAFFLSLPLA